MTKLSASRVKELLDYNPNTGVMIWKVNSWRKKEKEAGCFRKDGYKMIRIDNILYYRHRLAWLHYYGEHPKYTIDHINGVKGDDRINNLRDVTIGVNSQNQRKATATNKSCGLLGVQKNHNGWQAHITVNHQRILLGTYKTPEEAHNVYVQVKRIIHEGCTI